MLVFNFIQTRNEKITHLSSKGQYLDLILFLVLVTDKLARLKSLTADSTCLSRVSISLIKICYRIPGSNINPNNLFA